MRRNLPVALVVSVALLFFYFPGFGQTCPLLSHNSFTNFNSTPNPQAPTSLWLNIHTKLDNTNLTTNGDYLLFTGGAISLTGVTSTPMVSNVPIPDGKIVADNTVSQPVTSYDMISNTWITRVPPGFSSSDIFISGAIINSSTGFSVSAGKSSTITGHFFSNKSSFKQSWFYGLATYRPEFSYSSIGSAGQVSSVGGGVQAGTPIPEKPNLVAGGSGGGGSNFTGSYSSTDNFTTCQKASCNLSGTIQKTDVTCNGAANGAAKVTLTGGTPPYTFSNSGGVFLQTVDIITVFLNLRPADYPFTVTDAAGCRIDLDVTISQPPVLGVSGIVVNASNNLSNGSITVTVTGGTPPYSFLWNTGAQTENLSGIGAGTYTLTVTDANGCTAALTETLTGQVCTSLSVSATVLRGDFQNSCDGAATINVTGGTAPFTYSWSDGVTTSTNSRNNLCGPPPGSGVPVSYTVTVTDAKGCSGSVSFLIDISSAAPSAVSPSRLNATARPFGVATGTIIPRIYPNPSSNLVNLLINSTERSNAVVNVTDMTGRIVKSFVINLEIGVNTKELQLPVHSQGIYMLQIKTTKDIKTLSVLLK